MDNPIDDRYWIKLWRKYDEYKGLQGKLNTTVFRSKIKVLLVAIVLLLFFTIPFPFPIGGGETRWLSICEAIIRPDLVNQFYIGSFYGQRLRDTYSLEEFISVSLFVYKWLGIGAAYCLLYWTFFLSPYDKIRGLDTRFYVQEVVFEKPSSYMVFAKKSFKHEKYRWLGFFYGWCMGFVAHSIIENDNWMLIIPYQDPRLAILPSYGLIPIVLILSIVVSVIFGIMIGQAAPKTRSGSIKKTLGLAGIGACLLVTVFLTFLYSDIVRDFLVNWNSYSIKLEDIPPQFPTWGPDIYINENSLAWTMGMIITAVFAMFFPLVCTAHQNKRVRSVVMKHYRDLLASEEHNWEYGPIRKRLDKEAQNDNFVKKFAALELAFFFGLFLFTFWGLMYAWTDFVYISADQVPEGWQRDLFSTLWESDFMEPDLTNYDIGVIILAIEIVWALVLSPIYHYNLRKGTEYRGKSLGYAVSEDRGIGSIRYFWYVFWLKKKRDELPPELKSKAKGLRRFIWFSMGIVVLWICGVAINDTGTLASFDGIDDYGGILNDIASALSIDPISPEVAVSFFSIVYIITTPLLLIYALSVLKFKNPKDPDRGKKKIYGLILVICLALLTIGIADLVYRQGDTLMAITEHPVQAGNLAWMVPAVLSIIILIFLLIVYPVMMRLDHILDVVGDFIMLIVVGIIILVCWNFLAEFTLTDPRLHWSWRFDNPADRRNNFLLGDYLTGAAGYFYWGWVQQLLFLGYFTNLLYKTNKNKLLNTALSSLLFMMFHWDNIAMVVATAMGAFVWSILWKEKEKRNLFVFGYTHGSLESLCETLLPMYWNVGPTARY